MLDDYRSLFEIHEKIHSFFWIASNPEKIQIADCFLMSSKRSANLDFFKQPRVAQSSKHSLHEPVMITKNIALVFRLCDFQSLGYLGAHKMLFASDLQVLAVFDAKFVI